MSSSSQASRLDAGTPARGKLLALTIAGPLFVPLVAVGTAQPAAALGNGLALTPQLGFNDWNAYGCDLSESVITSTAQAMHSDSMQAAGYSYVNIDGCWMTHSRDGSGRLVPEPAKFPDGIKGCNNSGVPDRSRYTAMRDPLAATGPPTFHSLCNRGQDSVWTWGAGVGNSRRTTGDINAGYSSMLSMFHSNESLASYAGPGHWNDPDMLEVGNGSLSATEKHTGFSLRSEMAAPLIAGTNMASASAATLSTLTNTRVIAVDQDPRGRQGTLVSSSAGPDVLAKPLACGDVSVALFNETGSTATIGTTAAAIGKTGASSYALTDLWSGTTSTTSGAISASVPHLSSAVEASSRPLSTTWCLDRCSADGPQDASIAECGCTTRQSHRLVASAQ